MSAVKQKTVEKGLRMNKASEYLSEICVAAVKANVELLIKDKNEVSSNKLVVLYCRREE